MEENDLVRKKTTWYNERRGTVAGGEYGLQERPALRL